VGDVNRTLLLYDVITWKMVKKWELGLEPELVEFNPDGTRLAIAGGPSGECREIQVRDVSSGNLKCRLSHPNVLFDIAWQPNGNLLAVASYDSQVYLWNIATGRQYKILRGHQASAVAVAFSPGGDFLLSGSWDGSGRLWDPWTGRQLVQFRG